MKFQTQVFEVARFCARKRGEDRDVEEEELDPARVRLLANKCGLGDPLRPVEVDSDMVVDREDGNSTFSRGLPKRNQK